MRRTSDYPGKSGRRQPRALDLVPLLAIVVLACSSKARTSALAAAPVQQPPTPPATKDSPPSTEKATVQVPDRICGDPSEASSAASFCAGDCN